MTSGPNVCWQPTIECGSESQKYCSSTGQEVKRWEHMHTLLSAIFRAIVRPIPCSFVNEPISCRLAESPSNRKLSSHVILAVMAAGQDDGCKTHGRLNQRPK